MDKEHLKGTAKQAEGEVKKAAGKMTGKKFREWCAKMGIAVQEEEAHRGDEIVKLVVDKPKKVRASK